MMTDFSYDEVPELETPVISSSFFMLQSQHSAVKLLLLDAVTHVGGIIN